MFIADAHCDFLTKAAKGADFYSPKLGQHISDTSLINANIGLISFAVFGGSDEGFNSLLEFMKAQTNCYRNLIKSNERIVKIPRSNAYCYLSFEGLDFIEKIEDLGVISENNPLTVGIMWNNKSNIGGSCRFNEPLTKLGLKVIMILEKDKIAIDLAHAGTKTFFDVFHNIKMPFVSHANAYKICEHKRNLTDEQIKLLIKRNSFLGITLYRECIGGKADIKALFKHINYILELGGENILGFGGDLDGCEDLVNNANSASVYNLIIEQMYKQKYSNELIEKIANKNLIRYLSTFEKNTC